MSSNTRRESIEVLGLQVIRHSVGLTPQGRAADAAGYPTSGADYGPTETAFELHDSETRQSVIDSLRAAAAHYGRGRSEEAQEVASLLLSFADRVEQIDETVGELLARTGLEESDRVEIRFPTVAEDAAKIRLALMPVEGRVA
jgi:hypothetical protein